MKKKLLILVVGVIAIFNLSILIENNDGINIGLDYLKIAKAETEMIEILLPEVEFICDYYKGYGRCWEEDCHFESTPFGSTRVTFCPNFTGRQANFCVPGMLCW